MYIEKRFLFYLNFSLSNFSQVTYQDTKIIFSFIFQTRIYVENCKLFYSSNVHRMIKTCLLLTNCIHTNQFKII